MAGKSPDATCRSVPAFPGDILDHAVGSKRGEDSFNIAGIHAPHIPRQCVVYRLTIFQAYGCICHSLSPSLPCLAYGAPDRPYLALTDRIETQASHGSHDRPWVIRTSGEPVYPSVMLKPLSSRLQNSRVGMKRPNSTAQGIGLMHSM
jgi:hypothetical protein